MGVCTAFVFAALVEFTCVNYLWRKKSNPYLRFEASEFDMREADKMMRDEDEINGAGGSFNMAEAEAGNPEAAGTEVGEEEDEHNEEIMGGDKKSMEMKLVRITFKLPLSQLIESYFSSTRTPCVAWQSLVALGTATACHRRQQRRETDSTPTTTTSSSAAAAAATMPPAAAALFPSATVFQALPRRPSYARRTPRDIGTGGGRFGSTRSAAFSSHYSLSCSTSSTGFTTGTRSKTPRMKTKRTII
jgi:hypothetical protein